jgi:hypothetical protein
MLSFWQPSDLGAGAVVLPLEPHLVVVQHDTAALSMMSRTCVVTHHRGAPVPPTTDVDVVAGVVALYVDAGHTLSLSMRR